MPKFKKKPIVIEALQLTPESFTECLSFLGDAEVNDGTSKDECYIGIVTLEGDMAARDGDWIIKGVNGEFYPCKPDIFVKTYDPVEETNG